MTLTQFPSDYNHGPNVPSNRLPYQRRRALLSRGEVAFFRALCVAVKGRYLIAFKVRLADLVTCQENAWDAGFGHMIARQHLDFVLCHWRSTDILLTIELDDRSHKLIRRKRRDAFLNKALLAAKIPLVRFQAAARYNPKAIAETIGIAMKHRHST